MKAMHKSALGFSLLELIIVGAVMIVATAVAVPAIQNAQRTMRLRGATVDLASFLQRARIGCVQQNRALPVLTNGANTQIYFDVNASGGYDAGEPTLFLPPSITVLNDAGASDIAAGTLGFAPQPGAVRFNGRGLPCVVNGAGVCSNFVGANEVGFIYYLNQNINGVQKWSAVSVTPAGQVRTWVYNSGAWTNN
jgi:Tfp pilus assembly protein FimT